MTRLPAMTDDQRLIDSIRIPHRHRKDLGSLDDLRDSIDRVGLLHPVVVDASGCLVAGERRVAACVQLGWKRIPARVVSSLYDARLALVAERDENVCRKDMSPSEKVALGRELEKLERPKAEERQRELGRTHGTPSEKFPQGSRGERTGKVYDLVGEAVGMSGPIYKRAKAIVTAAESGDPMAVEAKEMMDISGKVTPAYERLNQQRVAAALMFALALHHQVFRAVDLAAGVSRPDSGYPDRRAAKRAGRSFSGRGCRAMISGRSHRSLNESAHKVSMLGLTDGAHRRRGMPPLAAAPSYPGHTTNTTASSSGNGRSVSDAYSGQAGRTPCRNCGERPAVSYHGRCEPCEEAFADLWLGWPWSRV